MRQENEYMEVTLKDLRKKEMDYSSNKIYIFIDENMSLKQKLEFYKNDDQFQRFLEMRQEIKSLKITVNRILVELDIEV